MATSYRTAVTSTIKDSSDEGELSSSDSNSDDDSSKYSKKRARIQMDSEPMMSTTLQPNHVMKTTKRSKNANIWGSVLTEQCSQDISTNLGAVGMQHLISRGPESFDLPSHFSRKRRDQIESDSDDSSNADAEESQAPPPFTEPPKLEDSHAKKNGSNNRGQRKRKVSKNSKNVPTFKPGQEVKLNRRCELSDSDPVDKVAEEIAFRLWERKKDLIRLLTETLGIKTAIEFYNKTEDIEKSGGLLTMTGLRRRTPGGTFLYLIRNDPKLNQDSINEIFSLEAERERQQWEQRKKAKRKKNPESNSTEQSANTAEFKEIDAMDCHNSEFSGQSDDITENATPDMDTKTNITDYSSNATNFKKSNAELSDGEIIDSDEAIDNAESFG